MIHVTQITLPEGLDSPRDILTVEATVSLQSDGIGVYEFWGATYIDHGNDYAQVDEITPQFTDESDEQRAAINRYIKQNFISIAREIESEITLDDFDPCPDYCPEEEQNAQWT